MKALFEFILWLAVLVFVPTVSAIVAAILCFAVHLTGGTLPFGWAFLVLLGGTAIGLFVLRRRGW